MEPHCIWAQFQCYQRACKTNLADFAICLCSAVPPPANTDHYELWGSPSGLPVGPAPLVKTLRFTFPLWSTGLLRCHILSAAEAGGRKSLTHLHPLQRDGAGR